MSERLEMHTLCECGHALDQHAPTMPGPCLFGFIAPVFHYSEGRHGKRKCDCADFRAAAPPAPPPR